ncbi:MAG: inorganic diphosphatase [Desulforudis sp.]|nr:MAG: inorganic diphosphatase [Desulforudis sp.]
MIVEAVIEIPRGSSNKYEYDRHTGDFRLDRVLYSPIHYPTDYGFIPHTLTDDGDELDIMVMISKSTFPGCRVRARVLGALEMTDEKGKDIKVLAAAVSDPRMNRYRDISDVGRHTLKEIEYFFAVYKDLEEKKTIVNGWRNRTFAESTVQESRLYPAVHEAVDLSPRPGHLQDLPH